MRGGAPSLMNAATVPGVLMTPTRYYVGTDRRVYVDFPPQLGYPCGLMGVPVLGGGGVADRYAQTGRVTATDQYTPTQLPQVVVIFIGTERRPYAMEPVSAAATTIPITSHGWVNGASSLSLTDAGNLIAALHASATFTVSRGGEADGRLTLVAELVSYLQDLTTQLNILLGRVAVCEAAIPIPTPPPIPPVTFPDPADYTLGAAALPVASDAE
jgi:hypothetical protein